jgi:calcineurin-like phosphoesterase
MRILYIAEIVGKPGLYAVKTLLPTLRKERKIDFVIANGDAVTGGFGIGKNHSIYLRKLGVDVITGGDMTFYKKDMAEHIDRSHYILRPANLPPEMPGRGWRHYSVRPMEWNEQAEVEPAEEGDAATGDAAAAPASSETPSGATPPDAAPSSGADAAAPLDVPEATMPEVRLAVISLIGQSGYDRTHGSNPYTYLNNTLERLGKGSAAVIVDFHALTTAEKYTMFHYADGKVTAVIGSGQRVQTADAQVFPSGTAVICDAGRTGSIDSVSGLAPQTEIRKYLTRIPIRSEECWDRLELQGTILDIDLASGYVVGFEALRVPCDAPPPGEKEQSGQGGGRSGGGRPTGGNKGNGPKADGHKGGGRTTHGQKKDG